jgi:5-methyltetrahydrofolate--homocysteine methyltransferase
MSGPGLLERIAGGEVLVGDGALGTMLFERGLAPGACLELVNVEHPDWLTDITEAYRQAGSDLVTTNTFGGSSIKLADYGLEDRTEELNRRGVEIVREAADGSALVAASVGPTGKLLQPIGDVSVEQVRESFERQVAGILEGGPDVVIIETMMDPAEAVLAVGAAKSLSPNTPVIATMTFDATPRGFFTMMGTTVPQAVSALQGAGADVVGSNCGNGIDAMVELARAFRDATDGPLIIQSNAGMPEQRAEGLVYPESPEFMATRAATFLDVGVAIVGGCCGTTPEHISALRAMVDGRA